MRKITAGPFSSLDGVVEAPGQWHFPHFNEEMGDAVDATLGAADINEAVGEPVGESVRIPPAL